MIKQYILFLNDKKKKEKKKKRGRGRDEKREWGRRDKGRMVRKKACLLKN